MTEASSSFAKAHGGRLALVCVVGALCTNTCATGVDSPLDLAGGGGGDGPASTAATGGTDVGAGGSPAGTGGSSASTTGPAGPGGTSGGGAVTGPGTGGAGTTVGSGGVGGANGGAAGTTSAGGNGGSAPGGNGGAGGAQGGASGAAGQGGTGGASGAGGASKDASVADVVDAGTPKDAAPDVPCPLGGTALSFTTASSTMVVVPGAAIPTGSSRRTVEMWVFNKVSTPNWSPNHTIFEYGGSGSMQTFGVDFDTFPRMELYVNPASLSYYFDAGITQDGWFHVAAVYDGNVNHAYINGVEKGTGLVVGTLATTASSFYLGAGSARNYFTGSLDEVRVWSVARTQTQIQQNMNVRLVGNETGLVGYWRFDEGSGSTARDSAGASNGALTNAPAWVPSGATLMCR